jgi:hypothetical protein
LIILLKMDQDNSNNDNNLNNELSSMNITSSSHNKKKNTCLHCLQEVEGSLRCSKCRTALYCGKHCQSKHWPVHKNICQDSNSEDTNDKLRLKAENHFKQGN